MLRIVVGLLLLAHGLVHLLYLAPRPEDDPSYPFVPETRWSSELLGLQASTAKTIAASLGVVVALVLLVSGVSLIAGADIWRTAATLGSLLSLTLLLAFFHPWLSIGVAIDVAIVAIVWFAQVPASLFE